MLIALKKIGVSLLLAALVWLNLVFWKSSAWGLVLTTLCIFWFGALFTSWLLPEIESAWKAFFGALLIIAVIVIVNTLIYFFWMYNSQVFIFSSSGIALISLILGIKSKEDIKIFSWLRSYQNYSAKRKILLGVFFLLSLIELFILIKSSTFEALRTPWEVVPKDFLLVYFLATIILLTLTYAREKSTAVFFAVFLHYFITLGVALIIYRLGYGFDPVIHQASEKAILADGVITPKTFYYIGQYVFVVFLSRLSSASIETIDTFLVPIFYSAVLPLAIYYALKKIMRGNYPHLFVSLAFLLYPVSSFIATTPQALSNIFTIASIILSVFVIFGESPRWILTLFLLSFAALAIHPLSGIPALLFFLFTIFLHVYRKKIFPLPELQKFLLAEFFIIGSIAIPIIFLVQSFFSQDFRLEVAPQNITNVEKLTLPASFLQPYLKNNFNIIFDIIYSYENNFFLLAILLAMLGILILVKRHSIKSAWIYGWMFLMLFLNYYLLSILVTFYNLIDYERQNYPERVRELSFYFLLPLVLYTLLFAAVRSLKKPVIARIILLMLVATGMTAALYISYPRLDEYQIDKGYNLTQADIAAVHAVEENSQGEYIVLANQMTSVASIKEFGFKKYFRDEKNPKKLYFYYPIPTGGELYQYYLKMVYEKPRRETARGAAELVGVKNVYLVLNKYWERYDELVEEAKLESDEWMSIEEGRAYVFRFSF